jgi:hypothetical protein
MEQSQRPHLGSGLALELGDQGLQAVIVGLDTDNSEELLNVSGRGALVSTGLKEEVCSNVTHLQQRMVSASKYQYWCDPAYF